PPRWRAPPGAPPPRARPPASRISWSSSDSLLDASSRCREGQLLDQRPLEAARLRGRAHGQAVALGGAQRSPSGGGEAHLDGLGGAGGQLVGDDAERAHLAV